MCPATLATGSAWPQLLTSPSIKQLWCSAVGLQGALQVCLHTGDLHCREARVFMFMFHVLLAATRECPSLSSHQLLRLRALSRAHHDLLQTGAGWTPRSRPGQSRRGITPSAKPRCCGEFACHEGDLNAVGCKSVASRKASPFPDQS